jgi:alpha-tubulin suppressor-like RCC1 family protein
MEMVAGSFGGFTVDKKAELGFIIVNLTGINTVTGLSNAIAIDAGGAHAITLRSDSTAWTWGNNYWGTLGTGDEAFHGGPTRVTGLTGIESIAAGGDHTFAVQRDGTVMAWGNNMHKQLGMDDVPASVGSEGEYSPSPIIVPKN